MHGPIRIKKKFRSMFNRFPDHHSIFIGTFFAFKFLFMSYNHLTIVSCLLIFNHIGNYRSFNKTHYSFNLKKISELESIHMRNISTYPLETGHGSLINMCHWIQWRERVKNTHPEPRMCLRYINLCSALFNSLIHAICNC